MATFGAHLPRSLSVEQALGCMAALLGAAVLCGWQFDLDVLVRPSPSSVSTKANTAIAFLLGGCALALPRSDAGQWAAAWLGGACALMGIVTLAEYLLPHDLGIDLWLVADRDDLASHMQPGRMSPVTATCLSAIGIAALLDALPAGHGRRRAVSTALGAAVAIITLLVLAGHLIDRWPDLAWGLASSMPVYSALGCLALALAVARSSRGKPLTRWSLGLSATVGLALGFASLLAAAELAGTVARDMATTATEVDHAQQTLQALQDIRTELRVLESAQRGYVLSGDLAAVAPRESQKALVRNLLQGLLAGPGSTAIARPLEDLRSVVEQRLAFGDHLVETRRLEGFEAARVLQIGGVDTALTLRITEIVAPMVLGAKAQLTARQAHLQNITASTIPMVPLVSFLGLVAVLSAILIIEQAFAQRQEAEREAERSKAELQVVFDTLSEGIRVLGPDGAILRVNRAGAGVHGLIASAGSLTEAMAQVDALTPTGDVLSTKDWPGARALRGEFVRNAETIFRRRDNGATMFVEVTSAALPTAPGQPMQVVLTSHDITERKQAEAAAHQAELLSRSTVDALSAHIAIIDDLGRIIAVNRAWRRFAQLNAGTAANDPQVLEGANYLSVCDLASSGCGDAGRAAHGLRSVMCGQVGEYVQEYPCHSPDEQRWFNVRATRFEGTGPLRLVIAHENVTQRKLAESALRESEAQFRAFFENALDAILIAVTEGEVVAANAAACRMFGRVETQLVGCRRSDIVDVADPRLLRALRKSQISGKWRGELSFIRGDGSRFEGELSGAVFVDDAGVSKTCMIVHDITRRKAHETRQALDRQHLEAVVTARTIELQNANQDLIQARDAADAANRLKSSFLSNMSHEIRTPMSAIVGLARLVGTRISDEQSLGHLDKLQKASRHLLRIVNDVLDLSKIEAGQLKLESTAFEPREMLDDALGMLLEKAVAKGLTIELQVDPDVPQRMLGDPMRLQQILLNFLSNAIKFTAHGTIRVHAQAAERLDARILMRIEVQDAGIGMTAQEQERIFQPFSQADGSIARRFGGTGLGLVIARRLAELMEGEVGVHSAAGLGSTFWMTAWLHRSNAEHGWTPSRAMPLATVARTYKGFRLLLAEDNPVNQLVMSETLKNLEFEIDIVDNGLDAVERVRQCRYALVLMDMQMPLMDGLTATRAIRRMPGNERLPIFAMTANAFDDDRQRCMEAGMNEHLIKPVDIDQLEQTIARWLLSPSQGTSID